MIVARSMITLIFTILVLLSIGVMGIFVFGIILQKRMDRDAKDRGDTTEPGFEDSDDWGRGG